MKIWIKALLKASKGRLWGISGIYCNPGKRTFPGKGNIADYQWYFPSWRWRYFFLPGNKENQQCLSDFPYRTEPGSWYCKRLRLWSGRLYYKAVQSDDTAFQGKRPDEKVEKKASYRLRSGGICWIIMKWKHIRTANRLFWQKRNGCCWLFFWRIPGRYSQRSSF